MNETSLMMAPAKLTWELHVTGVRPDGYHLIEAEMFQLIAPVDHLSITPSTRSELVLSGRRIPNGPDNLVLRALTAVGRTARVELRKEIPVGAGLGGGSADAAAILRWAGCRDLDLAVSLGADVAFCLVGGRARVSGIGEIVEPLEPLQRDLTLLSPPLTVPTPLVYAAWDELGGPKHERNDLTAAALEVVPDLARWRDGLAEATGREPVLAGSGGSWFVEGHHDVTVHGLRGLICGTGV